jgi:transcriptional regulator with XRE-family HTH domain
LRNRVRKIQDAELAAALRLGLEQGSFSIVDAIRVMRVLEGMSQEALARRTGVTTNVIKLIDAGVGTPKISTLEKIAASFDLRIAFVGKNGSLKLFDARAWSAEGRMRRNAPSVAPCARQARSSEHVRQKSPERFALDYVLQNLS